jgi:hypothetical protein
MNEITLNEIFQTKGFSNTELILTGGSISPTGNYSSILGIEKPNYNILIGVKDGRLSFFGGGSLGMLKIKDNAVTLAPLISSIFLFGFKIIDRIFLPKENRRFRHLFDIPISDITEIVPQQKNNGYVVLNICEKSEKITKLCFHCLVKAPNILFANIMMDIFEKILRQGSLSKAEISLINEDIQEANELANKKILTAMFKGISTVVLASAIVVGVANRAVDRQAIRNYL